MKSLILMLALAVCVSVPAKAQTRVLVGSTVGDGFGNLFAGVSGKIEVPVKRFELDLSDNFSPIEQHINLGTGWANQAKIGDIMWLNNKVGIDDAAEYSNYHTSINKAAEYLFTGIVVKSNPNLPMRLTFNYVREFNNGIDKTGTESAHLQAGEFNLDMRTGCTGKFCFRTVFDFMIGHVLTQGNPLCDGTYGVTGGNGPNGSCPRASASSAAFTFTLSAEFPRRHGHEYDEF
jgi:hypothetical protein